MDATIEPLEDMYGLLARYEVRLPKEETDIVSDLRYSWKKVCATPSVALRGFRFNALAFNSTDTSVNASKSLSRFRTPILKLQQAPCVGFCVVKHAILFTFQSSQNLRFRISNQHPRTYGVTICRCANWQET